MQAIPIQNVQVDASAGISGKAKAKQQPKGAFAAILASLTSRTHSPAKGSAQTAGAVDERTEEPRKAQAARAGAALQAAGQGATQASGRKSSALKVLDSHSTEIRSSSKTGSPEGLGAQALGAEAKKLPGGTPAGQVAALDQSAEAKDRSSRSVRASAESERLKASRSSRADADREALHVAAANPNAAQAQARRTGEMADGEEKTEAAAGKKKANRREEDRKYSVIDLRMKVAADDAPGSSLKAELPDRVEGAGMGAGRGLGDQVKEGAERSASEAESAKGTQGTSFADTLAERLRAGSGELVRAAQVVLRDGDLGLIRLRLDPESLGGVKIELKLAEKQISGRIVVESDLAGEAFRSSLDSLKDAFSSAGFETTALEVEVRDGGQGGQGQGEPGDRQDAPRWSERLRGFEAAVPPAQGFAADGGVNMFV